MLIVWFGLSDIQTKLSGLGMADSMVEAEEENMTVSNRYNGKEMNRLIWYNFIRSSYSETLKSNNNEDSAQRRKDPSANLDINKEKRTQKFLLLILVSHFICILPINILK